MNKKTYREWYNTLEQNLDNLVSSLDNEESFYIQEDRQTLLKDYIEYNEIKNSLIEELILISDMKKLNDEIIFYLNLASEDLQNSIGIVK